MNKNKIKQAANYLEELSWLMESNKSISLKELSMLIRELVNERNDVNNSIYNINISNSTKYIEQPGKNYLVGVLPAILQDIELFKSNSDMLDFAEQVLLLKPSRAAKRSRNEYIGWIVCEVANTEESKKLDELYRYLRLLFSDQSQITKIKEAKKSVNFSWNEIISKL